jgi:hypothetical protein
VTKRARLAELLRAKAESSGFPAEAALFHARADQLDIERLNDEPFEPIPDAILYMVSLFEAG